MTKYKPPKKPKLPLTVKLSELLASKKIVHITFDKETIIYFEDGSRISVETVQTVYSEYTVSEDTEVVYYPDPKNLRKHQSIEVDTWDWDK